MAWIKAAAFPLNADLKALNRLLDQYQLEHRFVEEGGLQVLWVDSEQSARKVNDLLTKIQQGQFSIADHLTPKQDSIRASDDKMAIDINACPITLIVVLLSIGGYVIASWFKGNKIHSALSLLPFNIYPDLSYILSSGELWRPITPSFLHFGWVHLLMNGLFFFLVGSRLEQYLGRIKFIALFIILSLFSSFVEYAWSDSIFFGGLSGVLLGCFGFAAAVHVKAPSTLLELPRSLYISAFLSLLIGLSGILSMLFDIHVANGAHLGGFVGGVIVGTFYGDYCVAKDGKTK